MKKKMMSFGYLMAILSLAGCNLLVQQTPVVSTQGLDSTALVQTVYAQLTANAPATPTLQLESPTPAATATPQFSPTPSLSPTLTLTPTPSIPMIGATVNTNCRSGPGIVYPVIGYLLVSDKVPVLGRLANNRWWVIQHPKRPTQACWVWADTTVVEGDISSLPVATPPPTPTPTNTPTITRTPTITLTPTIGSLGTAVVE